MTHQVAVVGTGYWGGNHVRVMTELNTVERVVVCDADEGRRQAMRERFGDIETVASVAEIAADEGIDAVVVCTPATTHLDVALPLIEAGKHLLVEKPITITSSDAVEMIERAAAAGITLAVGHTFLFNAGVRAIEDRIRAGSAGDLHYLYARRCNLGPIRQDVNALWDLAPHDVSIFNLLVDSQPEWVSATGARVLGNEREDVGFVTIGYASGLLANIHASWVDPFKVRQLVAVGTTERIVFDDTDPVSPVTVVLRGVRPATPDEQQPYVVTEGETIAAGLTVREPLKAQAIDFLSSIEEGREPIATGEVGLRVVEVMEAIDASMAMNGTPVAVQHRSIRTGVVN